VNLQNAQFLLITYVNSPLNKKDQIERARRSQDTATFASLNFPAIKSIERIGVSFVESETHFFVYHRVRNLGVFVFDNKGDLAISGATETDPLKPVVRFNSVRNETDISITRIQLGNADNGMALVPHFTFKGNMHDADRGAPDSVVFDFASYANRKAFPGDTSLDIRCDEAAVFSGIAHLMLPDSASGAGTAQFLSAQIPVASFAKMGNAQKVNLVLGNKNFNLSSEDIGALRSMSSYISLPHRETR
jgi:hypothetical protein